MSSVIPPTIAGRSDELVGSEFVKHVPAADTPVGVLKRTEYSANHIALCIVVVLRADLIVERFIQVGAAGHGDCAEGYRRYIF